MTEMSNKEVAEWLLDYAGSIDTGLTNNSCEDFHRLLRLAASRLASAAPEIESGCDASIAYRLLLKDIAALTAENERLKEWIKKFDCTSTVRNMYAAWKAKGNP